MLTFGPNKLWQVMKAATSYNGYVEIIDHSDKGSVMAGWQGPNGTYDFIGRAEDGTPTAIYHARSLMLVDDKVDSHSNLPPGCEGALEEDLVKPLFQTRAYCQSI